MKVAIAWYGAEGQASYQYYVAKGDEVTIVTPQLSPDFPLPQGAKSIVGEGAFDHLNGFDIVIRSAGVRPDSLKTDGKIWSATNEFFKRCPAPIIGVTGTKGKGTTSSLIAGILKAGGNTARLVGNIGVPPLSLLDTIQPNDIVVYELSSFQLWDIEISPHIAVVLMIEPDHLNVHADMDEYVAAKANITMHQSGRDTVVYHPANEYSASIAEQSVGQKIRYSVPDDGGAYVQDGYFCIGNTRICPTDSVKLPGEFNLQNACAAITAAYPYVQDGTIIAAGLSSFNGLPHRLKLVAEKHGVKYYDDSIATTPGSAIAALQSFDGPKVIILGGESKGANYDEIITVAKQTGAQIVAMGQVGQEIATLAKNAGIEARYVAGLMDAVVPAAAEMADGKGVVLLSPAATSFGLYKNYADRGDQFVAAVEAL